VDGTRLHSEDLRGFIINTLCKDVESKVPLHTVTAVKKGPLSNILKIPKSNRQDISFRSELEGDDDNQE
jgi:hypothetical protein